MQLLLTPFRRLALIAIAALALAACGGGGSSDAAPRMEGSRDSSRIVSKLTQTEYPLSIYLPPASAGARSSLPVVYVLDGDSWFETLVGIAESTRSRLIIVAIGSAGQRNRDFVPSNSCTANGGGHTAFSEFLSQELIPQIERTVGGDPKRRILFGHSHGGSFALYAMFAQAPAQHTFSAYLASDSSLQCMPALAAEWDQRYAAAHRELPIKLHLSYSTLGNFAPNLAYSTTITERKYERLTFVGQAYTGNHLSIVPQALADGIAFALAPAR